MPFVSCPVIVYHWEESRAIFFTPSHHMFINIDQIPSGASFLQAKPQLSQPLLAEEMFQSLNNFSGSSGVSTTLAHFCTTHEFAEVALCPILQVRRSWYLPFKVFSGGMKHPPLKTWASLDVHWLTEEPTCNEPYCSRVQQCCNTPLWSYCKNPRTTSLGPN